MDPPNPRDPRGPVIPPRRSGLRRTAARRTMAAMAHPWPLFDLRIRTPRLELRLPTDDDLVALAAVVRAGVHDLPVTPFLVPWDELPSPAFERQFLLHWWQVRGSWSPEDWTLGPRRAGRGSPDRHAGRHGQGLRASPGGADGQLAGPRPPGARATGPRCGPRSSTSRSRSSARWSPSPATSTATRRPPACPRSWATCPTACGIVTPTARLAG